MVKLAALVLAALAGGAMAVQGGEALPRFALETPSIGADNFRCNGPTACPAPRVQLAGILIEPGDDPANPDTRDSIVVNGPKYGWSAAEIAQARRATGSVLCGPGEWFEAGSAGLVLSNREIVTNAHVFREAIAKGGPDALKHCVFRNQQADDFHQEIPIIASSVVMGTSARISKDNSILLQDRDYAVALLERPVEGAVPFDIDTSRRPPKLGEYVYGVSGNQTGAIRHIPIEQPTFQRCTIISYNFPIAESDTTKIYTYCDFGGGGSGGLNLIRDENGKLLIKAIFANGNNPDGSWGVVAEASPDRLTGSVGFDGPLLAAARKLDEAARQGTPTQTADNNIAPSSSSLSGDGAWAGIGAGDMDRLRKSTGYVSCPGSDGSARVAISAAALVMSNREIVTATDAGIDDLRDCAFVNWQTGDAARGIPIEASRLYGGFTPEGSSSRRHFIIARLAAPVEDAKPFTVSGKRLTADDVVYAVAASGTNNEPTLFQCRVVGQLDERSILPGFITECGELANSGAVNIVRTPDGVLMAEGVFGGKFAGSLAGSVEIATGFLTAVATFPSH